MSANASVLISEVGPRAGETVYGITAETGLTKSFTYADGHPPCNELFAHLAAGKAP